MADIVVTGGGFGGIPLAFQLQEMLGAKHTITLISDQDTFHFVPSNPWIVVGWRRPDTISVALTEPLHQRGIRGIFSRAMTLDPQHQWLTLENSQRLHYDHLVIATGVRPRLEAIPGFSRYSHSIMTLDGALQARTAWEAFVEDPGDIIVGSVQDSGCFGPAYEFAFILDRDLRERHLRDKARITLLTPEPWPGHFGIGGIDDSRTLLESRLREHDIRWRCNTRVTRLWKHYVDVETFDNQSRMVSKVSLRSDFTMLIPAFSGSDLVRGIDGLSDPEGFVITDEYQRNPRYPTIWSTGTAIATTAVTNTPVEMHTPMGGSMIESMDSAVTCNIRATLEGGPMVCRAEWSSVYLADMGNTGIAFIAWPRADSQRHDSLAEGSEVHQAKVAFERHFLEQIREGASDPAFCRDVIEALLRTHRHDPVAQ